MDKAVSRWEASEYTLLDLRGLGISYDFIYSAQSVYVLATPSPDDRDFYTFVVAEKNRGETPIPLTWQPKSNTFRRLLDEGYSEEQLRTLVAQFVLTTRKAGSEVLSDVYDGDVEAGFRSFVTTPIPPLVKKLLSQEAYEQLREAGITRPQLMAGFADLVLQWNMPIGMQKEEEVVAYLLDRFGSENRESE